MGRVLTLPAAAVTGLSLQLDPDYVPEPLRSLLNTQLPGHPSWAIKSEQFIQAWALVFL